MTDDPRDLTGERDDRDERLAALLQTEPLDDITRRRLVRTAMDASASEPTPASGPTRWTSRARVLAMAAAVVALLVVGATVILRDDPATSPTASEPPNAATSQQERRAGEATSPLSAADAEAFSVETPAALGDLGAVGSAAALRRAVTAAVPTAAAGKATAAPDEAAAGTRVQTSCDPSRSGRFPEGDIVATGTGTASGARVAIYVVEHRNGTRVAVTVTENCAVGDRVTL